MVKELPVFISVIFALLTLVSVFWFYTATRSKTFLIIAAAWTLLQTTLALKGVYLHTQHMPPPLMLFGIFPAVFFIMLVFITKNGKAFNNNINLKTLTYFHSIRLPVEIFLSVLYHYGVVSVYMTFEGTNFDIVSGLTAPFVAWFAFRTTAPNKKILLWWNVICLLLLLNVVVTAAFAIPSPIQKLAFNQPNIAVLYFPFNLLPTVIVPMVFFAHLAAIKRLAKSN